MKNKEIQTIIGAIVMTDHKIQEKYEEVANVCLRRRVLDLRFAQRGLICLKIAIPLAMLLGIIMPAIYAVPLHNSVFVNANPKYIFTAMLVIVEGFVFMCSFPLISLILESDKTVKEAEIELRQFHRLFNLFQLSSVDPSFTDIVLLTKERIKEVLVIMARHILLWEDRVKRHEGLGKEASAEELERVRNGLSKASDLLTKALSEQRWFGTVHTRREVFAIADPPRKS